MTDLQLLPFSVRHCCACLHDFMQWAFVVYWIALSVSPPPTAYCSALEFAAQPQLSTVTCQDPALWIIDEEHLQRWVMLLQCTVPVARRPPVCLCVCVCGGGERQTDRDKERGSDIRSLGMSRQIKKKRKKEEACGWAVGCRYVLLEEMLTVRLETVSSNPSQTIWNPAG